MMVEGYSTGIQWVDNNSNIGGDATLQAAGDVMVQVLGKSYASQFTIIYHP
jgi:hypothetical protein